MIDAVVCVSLIVGCFLRGGMVLMLFVSVEKTSGTVRVRVGNIWD